MAKVTYLNNHLDKYRPSKGPPKITIKYEDIDELFYREVNLECLKKLKK